MASLLVCVMVFIYISTLASTEELNQTTIDVTPKSYLTQDVPTLSSFEDIKPSSGLDAKSSANKADKFFSTLTTSSPMRTFKDEEKAIMDYVNTLLRQILPHIMDSASTKLTTSCMTAMMKSFAGLRKLKGWTLKLLDSSGKLSPGILTGTSYSMGDYDQCLEISVNSKGQETKADQEEMFRGKYCVIRLQQHQTIIKAAEDYHNGLLNASSLGKLKEMIEAVPFIPLSGDYMSHLVGVCIPSTCSDDDIKHIVQTLPFPGSSRLESCEIKHEDKPNNEQRAIIGIFLLLLMLVIIGTTVDKLLQIFWKHSDERFTGRKFLNLILSFSLLFNTRKLLRRIQNDEAEMPNWKIARGMFVCTVAMQIIHHTYIPQFQSLYRLIGYLGNMEKYSKEIIFSPIICLPLKMETLFFLYGLTLTNKIWKSTCKTKTIRIKYWRVLFGSYCQLYIPFVFCYAIIIVLPLFGSGPLWMNTYHEMSRCAGTKWWPILGMYNNLLTGEKQCLSNFWFIPCLMQLLHVAVVLMFFLSRWPKFGVFLTICGIISCNVAVGIETYKKQLPPAFLYYFGEKLSDVQWLIQESSPLIHFTPFAVGMLIGIVMARKATFRMSHVCVVLGWATCFTILGICAPFMMKFREKGFADISAIAAYASLQKTLYTLAITWVAIFAAYSSSGFVKSVLSWSVLDPLYKLSYFAYLLHMVIIPFHSGTARQHFHYTHFELIFRSASYVFLSYAAAYASSILITMPLKSITTVLFSSKFKQMNIVLTATTQSNGTKSNSLDIPFRIEERAYFKKF